MLTELLHPGPALFRAIHGLAHFHTNPFGLLLRLGFATGVGLFQFLVFLPVNDAIGKVFIKGAQERLTAVNLLLFFRQTGIQLLDAGLFQPCDVCHVQQIA